MTKAHWEHIYTTRQPAEVSWYQERPNKSLEWIRSSAIGQEAAIIDVGGGASTLVDHLLTEGYRNLTVMDISAEALSKVRGRLGDKEKQVHWMEADITEVKLSPASFDLWHDRAVFHFLTVAQARRKYLATMNEALAPGGYAIIATFALDGPPKCSGLEVVRFSAETLIQELGSGFALVSSANESHRTPFDTIQSFNYCCFKKI